MNFLQSELGVKRLGLLHELLPKATVIGMLINPNFADFEIELKEVQEAAIPLGLQIHVLRASTEGDIDTAFATLVQQKVDGLVLANDAFFYGPARRQLIALAARHAIPTVYFFREFPVDGGLMSYAPSLIQAYHQVGIYTGKILKGAKPADLPVVQPNKFEFVINLKTAKALGLTFPPGLLAIADEVIEYDGECPLLVQSRHPCMGECPLSGVKRTSQIGLFIPEDAIDIARGLSRREQSCCWCHAQCQRVPTTESRTSGTSNGQSLLRSFRNRVRSG